MWRLASARANDAVKLAFLPEEETAEIGRLDLAALTELKRVSNGTVELKFTDRMRALETLYRLLEEEEEDELSALYRQFDRDDGAD
ncbi:MAG: XRE family transcriptional regulator [Clostridium sp.]|nr:XRE family transcriptional regulator [Clostridium sp.]